MAAYQVRNGKPQVGYYGHGPGPQDYQSMAQYQHLKKLRKNIRNKCHLEHEHEQNTKNKGCSPP